MGVHYLHGALASDAVLVSDGFPSPLLRLVPETRASTDDRPTASSWASPMVVASLLPLLGADSAGAGFAARPDSLAPNTYEDHCARKSCARDHHTAGKAKNHQASPLTYAAVRARRRPTCQRPVRIFREVRRGPDHLLRRRFRTILEHREQSRMDQMATKMATR